MSFQGIRCGQLHLYPHPPISHYRLIPHWLPAQGVFAGTPYWKGGYNYAPIDENEHKTLTWRYLQEVNRQAVMLGTIIKQLKSTGVYFTSPAPEPSLPVLPGEYVKSVESDAPMMVGEFTGKKGEHYVMVVNLSLEKSAKFVLNTITPKRTNVHGITWRG